MLITCPTFLILNVGIHFGLKDNMNKQLTFLPIILISIPFTVTSQIKEIYPDSIIPLNFSTKEEKKINKKLDNCVFRYHSLCKP